MTAAGRKSEFTTGGEEESSCGLLQSDGQRLFVSFKNTRFGKCYYSHKALCVIPIDWPWCASSAAPTTTLLLTTSTSAAYKTSM